MMMLSVALSSLAAAIVSLSLLQLAPGHVAAVDKSNDDAWWKPLDNNCPKRFVDVMVGIRTPAEDCFVHTAVTVDGQVRSGVAPVDGGPDKWNLGDACGSALSRQTYARNMSLDVLGRLNEVVPEEVIIFAWYFPIEQTSVITNSHRHDWQAVAVWTMTNEFGNETDVRSICMMQNTVDTPLKWACYGGSAFDMFDVYDYTHNKNDKPYDTRPLVVYQRPAGTDLEHEHILVPGNKTYSPGTDVAAKRAAFDYDFPPCVSWDLMSQKARDALNKDPFGAEKVPFNDFNIEHYAFAAIHESQTNKQSHYKWPVTDKPARRR